MGAGPQTKTDYLYTQLRRDIVRGDLRPGTKLKLPALAARYGVSVIPLREAMRQLAHEGLIEMVPHMSPVVTDVSSEDALWIAELRLVLEPMAARAATGRIDQATFDRLEELVAHMTAAVHANDVNRYSRCNAEFHSTIYARGPNRRLAALLVELWEVAQRFAAVYEMPGHIEEGHHEHRAILDALTAEDANRVAALTAAHRARITENLKGWLATDALLEKGES